MSASHSKQSNPNTTKPKVLVKMSSPLSSASDSEIRNRAYQIYEFNGRQEHSAEQDWLRAERELLAERSK